MEEELRAALLAYSPLAALVGARITWLTRPQGAQLPGVTLQVISGPRDYTLGGRVGLVGYLVQVDVWADTYSSMKAVARAITGTGAAQGALDTLTTAPFQGAFVESEAEATEPQDGPDAAGSSDFYRTILGVRIHHQSAN